MQSSEMLSIAEWDFRSLTRKKLTGLQRYELQAAIRYEYARESDAIRQLAAAFADLSEDQVAQRGTLMLPKPPHLQLFTAFPFWNCVFWPRFFPQVPWLLIPQEQRTSRVDDYLTAHPPQPYLEINERDNLAEWELPTKGGRIRIGTVENLILSIDWSVANNKEILASFGRWLRNSRPGDIPEPRGDASRQNVAAAYLTRLGIMRLLHHYSFSEALNLALDKGVTMPMRQSNALLMRREVARDLRELFLADLFKLAGEFMIPPGELPRSWSTATEQRRSLGSPKQT